MMQAEVHIDAHLNDVPPPILAKIMAHLDARSAARMSSVSTLFRHSVRSQPQLSQGGAESAELTHQLAAIRYLCHGGRDELAEASLPYVLLIDDSSWVYSRLPLRRPETELLALAQQQPLLSEAVASIIMRNNHYYQRYRQARKCKYLAMSLSFMALIVTVGLALANNNDTDRALIKVFIALGCLSLLMAIPAVLVELNAMHNIRRNRSEHEHHIV